MKIPKPKHGISQNTHSTAHQKYLKSIQTRKKMIFVSQILIFIFFVLSWEILATYHIINDFIFCSPSRLYHTFFDMVAAEELFHHIGITIFETILGFLIVLSASLMIAIVFWWFPTLSKIFDPYLVVLNALPKSALAPLLIVWLATNKVTIIVCAISVAVFGSILNIYTGFTNVDPDKIKLILTLKGSRFDCLRYVVLPSNIPNIISIMKVNIGLCLVGVIIGEFLAAKEGLGYLIIYGSQTFKMSNVLLSIFILCFLAMLLYLLLQYLEQRITRLF